MNFLLLLFLNNNKYYYDMNEWMNDEWMNYYNDLLLLVN